MNKNFIEKLKEKFSSEIKMVEEFDTLSKLETILSFETYSFVQLTYFATLILDNTKNVPSDLRDAIDSERLIKYTRLDPTVLAKQKCRNNMFEKINAKLLVPYLKKTMIMLGKIDYQCLVDRDAKDAYKTIEEKRIIKEFIRIQTELQKKFPINEMIIDEENVLMSENNFNKSNIKEIFSKLKNYDWNWCLLFLIGIIFILLGWNAYLSIRVRSFHLINNTITQDNFLLDLDWENNQMIFVILFLIIVIIILVIYLIYTSLLKKEQNPQGFQSKILSKETYYPHINNRGSRYPASRKTDFTSGIYSNYESNVDRTPKRKRKSRSTLNVKTYRTNSMI